MADNQIGQLAESSLHAAIKQYLVRSGDLVETAVGGYIIDIVRGDHLIEIQTRHLYALRPKLDALLPDHTFTIVHPIAAAKWIVREAADGTRISRRKSPKCALPTEAFVELVRLPDLLPHPRIIIKLLITHQEEYWRDDGGGSWRRRGWSISDRRLLEVVGEVDLLTTTDYLALLPEGLPSPFTNKDVAAGLQCRAAVAQKMTYTLRNMGVVAIVGRQGRTLLMEIAPV